MGELVDQRDLRVPGERRIQVELLEPDAVTASGGMLDSGTPSSFAIAALRSLIALTSTGLSGP